ncbi:TetR/AcrR family transcriptional regulator [Gulosibacter macacae]|uniref:TetR/AcrR family transcriptional regulator n=1 Tax=Gulosibacter macacae TaxID=2488791 RepID=A0A3P3VXE7_9MICO|nr:TetR/AcrR family transcriptional regulator [Gulosibacter macacae]RRJ87154.1 TetR/AcrR family transcriptional regulator [Gulosibacter macacae]
MDAPQARAPRQRLDVDQRRDELLTAAVDVFAGATYSAVTVAQIAEAAGASPALVFHYFGNKAGIYAAVVELELELLLRAQLAAERALDPNSASRDRVRAHLLVLLERVEARPSMLAAGDEPAAANEVRAKARARTANELRRILGPTEGWARHDYALAAWSGFVGDACRHWAERGYPESERFPLIDTALGALEGALGDWMR